MEHFLSVADLKNPQQAVQEAIKMKLDRYRWDTVGINKTLIAVFFNSSLRTRLSIQKAAMNLGMNVMVLNVSGESWNLETETGVVMNGDKPEHIREAIPVMGSYCDLMGVRSFAGLTDREVDYQETVLQQFVALAGVPIVSLESATRHPLQSFADMITIEELKRVKRPKVVLTWAPHPNPLPQAVANSFAEWATAMEYDLTITHPKGYDLAEPFTQRAIIEYDQNKAFEGADFVYAKSWSSYQEYGKVLSSDTGWTVSQEKMNLTNEARFMHCLPVRRNVVVSDQVIESPNSVVIPQAANREIAAQAVLLQLLR